MSKARALLGSFVDEAVKPYEVSLAGGEDQVALEAAALSASLREFVLASWPHVWPNEQYIHGWHVDAVCEYLQYVSDGEIKRLQIWIPPGSSKSTIVSIMWPAWEWTRAASMRYITASYAEPLSTRFAVQSRDLIASEWYQLRWPHVRLRADWNLKTSYANVHGGTRISTSVGGIGTGQHGHRLIIDDPLNAQDVLSEAELNKVMEWHDGQFSTRFVDPKTSAEVIIMQRLGELDLAAHVLEIDPQAWTILCLPERYEADHPHCWPGDPRDPNKPPRLIKHADNTLEDVEQGEGAFLCPRRIGANEHRTRLNALGAHRAAGQLQQRPAPREGVIIKRSLWRYYPAAFLDKAELGDTSRLPKFTRIVCGWDTSFKEKTSSDYVCGLIWGISGGQRYLLRRRWERMGFAQCKTAMLEAHRWSVERWPHAGVTTLVENRANGPEIIATLQREITGVIADNPTLDKVTRAEACEPDFEGGAVYVPGAPNAALDGYDTALTPAWVQDLIEECAVFPNGQHDDQVDAVTMSLNWARVHAGGRAFGSKPQGRVPQPRKLRLVS